MFSSFPYMYILSIRTTFRDKVNRDVCDVMVREVRAHNSSFLAADIRGIYMYFYLGV